MRPAVRHAALAMAMISARPLAAQQPFEGVITVQMREGQAGDMQYYVRQGAARVEMTGGRGRMIMITDPQKQTMYMVMPERQTYMERPLATPTGMVSKDAPPEPKIERTGRMETVAGLRCEHVTITTERGPADACMTQELGAVTPMMGGGMRGGMRGGAGGAGGGGTGGGWRGALSSQRDLGFPLKVVSDGQTVWEVTKVERKTLDASLFAVPAGYQPMQMPMGPPGGQPPQGRPPVR